MKINYSEPINSGRRRDPLSKGEKIARLAHVLIAERKGQPVTYHEDWLNNLIDNNPHLQPNKSATFSVQEFGYYRVVTVGISKKFYEEAQKLF
jgi:hypothetical protein